MSVGKRSYTVRQQQKKPRSTVSKHFQEGRPDGFFVELHSHSIVIESGVKHFSNDISLRGSP